MDPISNRLVKNYKKLRSWSERHQIEAYRLYDRDIPDYPFIIDIYKDYVVVYDKSDPVKDRNKNHLPPTLEGLKTLLGIDDSRIILKKRFIQDGVQYQKLSDQGAEFIIREHPFKFLVNPWDYLDTGLFLDHRPLRHQIYKMAAGQKVLNLFCYTGSVSVAAALGGGTVTSVDMSNTYLEWAKRNFTANDIDPGKHEFIQADVLQYLKTIPLKPAFDIIFLDPPTFSNSKRMRETLDTQRDHFGMIENCLKCLSENGILFFSTNKRKFKIDPKLYEIARIQETTASTIPQDFHDLQIHTSFDIRKL